LKPSLDDSTSFGGRFSVSGNTVVAGAAANFNSLFKRGSVYVFDIALPNDGQRTNNTCIDADGDGWGWNPIAGESCSPRDPSIPDGCDYSQSALHDGWGWNAATQQSCAPLVDSQ